MPRITFNVEGERQTVAKLKNFDMKRTKDTQTLVKKTMMAVKKSAKKKVSVSPKGTKKAIGEPGDLKRSLRHKYYYNNLGAMVFPDKKKGFHRGIIEAGTKVRRNRGRVTPRPFMQPSKEEVIPGYVNEMERIYLGRTEEI